MPPRKKTKTDMSSSSCRTPQEQLEQLLNERSDVLLVFGKDTLPGHSITLSQWSNVLRSALEAGSSSGSTITIPMEGTKKEDWLTVMQFVYPLVPCPSITWENLETVFTLSSKYDMPALLDKAGQFLATNKEQLLGSSTSPYFAWKWIVMADSTGLTTVAQECIDAVIDKVEVMRALDKDQLQGISLAASLHLTAALAAHYCGPGEAYCSKCKRGRGMQAYPYSSYGNTSGRVTCVECHESFKV